MATRKTKEAANQAAIKIGTHVRIVGNTESAGKVGIVHSGRHWGTACDAPWVWEVEVPSGALFTHLVPASSDNLQPICHALYSRATGERIEIGTTVTDSDGEEMRVVGFTPGRRLASTGRVCVRHSDGSEREYYPSVIDAEIREAK